MDSSNIDNGHPSCGDEDDKNEDKDNENNKFVDNTILNLDNNAIDNGMNYNNVNENLTVTVRGIFTGYYIFGE